MSSHKSDHGRIPRPRDPASQRNRDANPSATNVSVISGSAHVSQTSRSHIARPSILSSRSGRSSSFSTAEELRSIPAPSKSSRSFSSSSDVRPSLLPRPTSGSFSSGQRRPSVSPSPASRSMQPPSSNPATTGFARSRDNKPAPTSGRPRNVLRRRAPTIGQHTERNGSQADTSQTEKLSVTIPNTRAAQNPEPSPHSRWGQPALPPGPETYSPFIPQEQILNKPMDQPVSHGPKELASLRTTINSQNLPPPTPNFPSASSPSTRYSESPGIWSRTSTPTSLSSYSPGIIHSAKIGHRLRQTSPSQTKLPIASPSLNSVPQVERVELKAVASSLLTDSAESGAPIGTGQHEEPPKQMESAKVPAPPHSPPPRKSSTKFKSPKQEKEDLEAIQKREEEAEKRVFDPLGSQDTVTTSVALAEPSQAPVRPSRDGTHRLELQPSPVIRSNLASLKVTGHKRRESAESARLPERPHPTPVRSAATSMDSLQSKSSSRIPSRVATSPAIRRKSPRTLTKEPKEKQDTKNTAAPKRFGLFTKKSKPDVKTPDPGKAARKGPAAGTGHEGYGRYGQRGRKASVSSNSGTRARSTSTTRSAASKASNRTRLDLEIDDFLLDRLEPVIISGGGMDGSTLMRTQSEQSVSNFSVASSSSQAKQPKGPQPTGDSTESLVTSTGTSSDAAEPMFSRKNVQISPDKNITPRGAGSAIGQVPNKTSVLDLKGIRNPDLRTYAVTASTRPSIDSHNPTLTSLTQTKSIPYLPDHGPEDGSPNKDKKPEKKGKGMRWNFFQRSHGTDRKKSVPAPPVKSATQLHAAISPVAVSRPVAHYALVDADSDELEDIINRIEESPPTEVEETALPVEIPANLSTRKPHGQSILLPSPPKMHGEFPIAGPSSPKVFFNKTPSNPGLERSPEGKRPSRLASVGRIPQVVSRRDREHKPAVQSFSRPFSGVEVPPVPAAAPNQQYHFNAANQSPYFTQTHVPSGRPFKTNTEFSQFSGAPAERNALDFIAGPYSQNEFLRFSPRKDSMLSSSSGSDSLAAVTAKIPEPGSPPTEDEVWKEYDDLIDHVLSPEATNPRRTSKPDTEEKFGLATMASKALQAELNANPNTRALSTLVEAPSVALTPASARSSNSSVHLRRSQIAPALHSSITPSTQVSYSSLIAGYGDMGTDTMEMDSALGVRHPDNQTSFLYSPSSAASQSFETSRQRNTILYDMAERDREGAIAQANIRSGSLMTSRWLSFGRVLFSPAHNHVQSNERERILVVDGLGNDDWSFYCALTYPMADVYSLNVGPTPAASTNPAAWQPPANHHTIHHDSLERSFPFPKGFFTVTVLRFPAACSEGAHRNVISECNRVLRTGGYLEMSLLDLDMVNMGVRTRRAVRKLKERTYLADASISLKPASDSFQRLLGRHGFDGLRRCMVRIPVAGVIVRSSDSSSSNQSTSAATGTPSTGFSLFTTSTAGTQTHNKSPSEDTELSLGDLLSDPTPSPSNDESIAKMVAKVGRWWYTRCYEIPVLQDGDLDLSIWADKKVLRECQKRGTGFRFLIAYAQKPSEVKRRTASV